MTEAAGLLKRVVMLMVWTHKALGLEVAPDGPEDFRWRPLLEKLESVVSLSGLEASGVASLRSFTATWDERLGKLAAGERPPEFSSAEIRALTRSLVEYEAWLRAHFPKAFLPPNLSSN